MLVLSERYLADDANARSPPSTFGEPADVNQPRKRRTIDFPHFGSIGTAQSDSSQHIIHGRITSPLESASRSA
jgi:hypothetical protein